MHRQTTLRMRERVTSLYFKTVVTADSTNRGKCSIKTSNRDVSFLSQIQQSKSADFPRFDLIKFQ